jgi:hypothetical protein
LLRVFGDAGCLPPNSLLLAPDPTPLPLGLRLVSDDGQHDFDEFLIHIHGNEARFRY